MVISGCLRKNKHYTTYSGVDPGMSLAQAKDYCSAIASSAKSGAKSAFQQAQNKKKKKRYWSDGMFVHEQEVSGGFAGGFAEGLAKGLKGNAAYSRVMKGCMAEQGYKLTTKSSTSHKPKSKSIFYCKTPDGGFRINKGAFGGANCRTITKAEYDRKGKKTTTASTSSTSSSKIVYCKMHDGTVYTYPDLCGVNQKITKAEYNRLKNKNSH